jgi:glucan phosphoethanolaminetransferase (alkaline phosphatase superfamily)
MKKHPIDKAKFNIIIDLIMLLLMMPIAGIGLLIKYILVPGLDRNVLYGNNVDLEFLGQTRHQWGSIHLLLSIIFLFLLVVHIILHWKMIVNIFQRMFPIKLIRIVLATFIATMGFLLISFPLFIKPEIVQNEPLRRNRSDNNFTRTVSLKSESSKQKGNVSMNGFSKSNPENKHHHHYLKEKVKVYGSQTLQFVADRYHVPVSVIAADLKIPKLLSSRKLGLIRKQYSFTMDDVRVSIINYKKRRN